LALLPRPKAASSSFNCAALALLSISFKNFIHSVAFHLRVSSLAVGTLPLSQASRVVSSAARRAETARVALAGMPAPYSHSSSSTSLMTPGWSLSSLARR
jgi:hypothetical protein